MFSKPWKAHLMPVLMIWMDDLKLSKDKNVNIANHFCFIIF
ncbi:hypothetical protein [Moraxella lacunata]